MAHLSIPKRTGDDREEPGPWWWPLQDGDKRSASFRCPDCGDVGVLTDHTIEANGKVAPSVVCPRNCGFHAYVVLEDWPATASASA